MKTSGAVLTIGRAASIIVVSGNNFRKGLEMDYANNIADKTIKSALANAPTITANWDADQIEFLTMLLKGAAMEGYTVGYGAGIDAGADIYKPVGL